jgi:hypothetical protein
MTAMVNMRFMCDSMCDSICQFDTPVVEAALKRANGGVAMASKAYRQGDIDSRSVFESFIRRQWPCPTSPRITS